MKTILMLYSSEEVCSGTPLVRPPLLHKKVAFPEWMASRQGGLSKGVPLYVKWICHSWLLFGIFVCNDDGNYF